MAHADERGSGTRESRSLARWRIESEVAKDRRPSKKDARRPGIRLEGGDEVCEACAGVVGLWGVG